MEKKDFTAYGKVITSNEQWFRHWMHEAHRYELLENPVKMKEALTKAKTYLVLMRRRDVDVRQEIVR